MKVSNKYRTDQKTISTLKDILRKRRDEDLRLKATTLELADIEEVAEAGPFVKRKTRHIVMRYLD